MERKCGGGEKMVGEGREGKILVADAISALCLSVPQGCFGVHWNWKPIGPDSLLSSEKFESFLIFYFLFGLYLNLVLLGNAHAFPTSLVPLLEKPIGKGGTSAP